jgi:hypothetical protein
MASGWELERSERTVDQARDALDLQAERRDQSGRGRHGAGREVHSVKACPAASGEAANDGLGLQRGHDGGQRVVIGHAGFEEVAARPTMP